MLRFPGITEMVENGGSHRGGKMSTEPWTMVRFYPGTVNRSDRWDHDRLKMCSPKLAVVPVPYESSNVKAGLILSLELFVLNGCKESRKTGLACSIGPQCDCMALRVLTARNKTFHSWKLRQSRPDTQS